MNKFQFIGRLGKDPEARTINKGDSSTTMLVSFSIATSENYKDKHTGERKQQTEWHNCNAWGKTAELIAKYVHKGDLVFLEGVVRHTSSGEGSERKYFTNFEVRAIEFLGSKGEKSGEQKKDEKVTFEDLQNASNDNATDDLPF